MLSRISAVLLAGVFLVSGCRTSQPTTPLALAELPVSYTEMTDSVTSDPALDAIIKPYRDRLEASMNEIIGEATAQLVKGKPESPLGNMAAEALLQEVNQWLDTPIDMALTNNGGLRTPIPQGPISVGKMYELMPFENLIAVLELNAVQVDSLAQQIARLGGEPIAGFTFTIDSTTRSARNILVNGQPLDENRTYRLVTSDYLANGGGGMPALWNPLGRQDGTMLLRDAFVEYVREKKIIEPMLDGRIRVE